MRTLRFPKTAETVRFLSSHVPKRGAAVAVCLLAALLLLSPVAFAQDAVPDGAGLRIGWATSDITPDGPVVLTGFSRARISEDVLDPITATALVLESVENGAAAGTVVMVSCDLIMISGELRDRVRARVGELVPELDETSVIVNGTHTHVGPEFRTTPDIAEMLAEHGVDVPPEWSRWGIALDAMPPPEYVEFAAGRIAEAVARAWEGRAPGGVSFGLSHAVVGGNRITRYADGSSRMYGGTDRPDFRHIEGYEDHSLGLLYTWDAEGDLTGVVINVAIPSQVSGGSRITADFWHETRQELRKRLGEGLYVFPQCAAAGDQSPAILIERTAEERMERLTGRTRRKQIGVRLADAVMSILPFMAENIEWDPKLAHRMEEVELTRLHISKADIREPRPTHHRPTEESVEEAFASLLEDYRRLRAEIEENPAIREESGWYGDITGVYWRLSRAARVLRRFELQQTEPTLPVEVHVIRIGDMAIATNPFELYLDFGMRIKARSPAIQTFLVQLAGGPSTYVPTERAVAGGAYGAIPESNDVGPEGGQELVEHTLAILNALWEEE